MERLDTWILLGFGAAVLLMWLFALLDGRRERIRALEKENAGLLREAAEVRFELQTIRARYDAKRDHLCLVRDEEIERLHREIEGRERKIHILEAAANRVWPKEGDRP